MILNWIPSNNLFSTGQVAKRVAKVNGNTPILSTGFSPTNPLIPSASTTTFTSPLDNIVYRFNVGTLCVIGNPTSNIFEMIQFGCVPISFEIRGLTQLYCQVDHKQHTTVDGVNFSNPVGDIENVEFSLYNSTGLTLLQGPTMGTFNGGIFGQSFSSIVFNGLTPSTTYVIKYTLISTINGVEVRSDNVAQIGQECTDVITLPTNGSTGFFSIANDVNALSPTAYIEVLNTLPIPFFILTSGTNIVFNEETSVGYHPAFAGAISFLVGDVFVGVAKLKVNGITIDTININQIRTQLFSFVYTNFLASDSIEIILEPTVSNLSFDWNIPLNNTAVNIQESVSGYGIDGTFDTIDWGDGTINTSFTHTYLLAGNYTINIFNSNSVELQLPNKLVNSILKIPNTLVVLNLENNNITNYPAFNNSNLKEVYMGNNNVANFLNFGTTLALEIIDFNNNNLSGIFSVLQLLSLKEINLSFNIGITDFLNYGILPGGFLVEKLILNNTAITLMPDVTSYTNLDTLDISDTLIVGDLDVTNNLLLESLNADNITLNSMPILTNNFNLVTLSLRNTTITGVLNLANNTNLTTIFVDNNNLTNLAGFANTLVGSGLFNNNNFSTSVVNTILTHINSINLTGLYTVNTQFQNPLAPPSGLGITAKAALILRSYTVLTD